MLYFIFQIMIRGFLLSAKHARSTRSFALNISLAGHRDDETGIAMQVSTSGRPVYFDN